MPLHSIYGDKYDMATAHKELHIHVRYIPRVLNIKYKIQHIKNNRKELVDNWLYQ